MTAPLPITGDLTIQTAADTAERIRAALPDAGAVTVDLSAVTDFDTAGLQVLMAARAECRRRDVALRLAEVPECVRAVLDIVRLDDQLDPVT